MGEYNFNDDLILGESGEEDIVAYLISKGAEFVRKNFDNKYDILMKYNGEEITYEIKTDLYCAPLFDTGNIFIEVECRNKKSGISVTEAKWFVMYFIFLKEIWFIETNKLKLFLEESNFPIQLQSGDLNSNTKGYLLKRKNIKNKFKIVYLNDL